MAHPPLIGYGLDGVPIFGRHLSSSAPGANTALDDCGGHQHSGIGDPYIVDNTYHYHSFVSNISSLNYASYVYTAFLHGPFMCWKGNITAVPNFFESNANPVARTDYTSGQIKPCTGSSAIYLAPGFSLNGASGTGFNYSSKVYTTGAGSTGGACAVLAPPPSSSPPPRTPSPPPPKPPSPPPAASSYSVTTSMKVATAKPPPPPVSGNPPPPTSHVAATCTVGASVTCSSNSSAAVSRSLTYSATTGKFTGTMTTNSCPSIVTTFTAATGTCATVYFPAAAYSAVTSMGLAAPITGTVGHTLSGMKVYNPLENGFSSTSGPKVCSTAGYYCAAGTDVGACISELYYTCGTAQKAAVDTAVAGTTFGDKCSGHASPYHFQCVPV